MIDSTTNRVPQRRWLSWRSGAPITAKVVGSEPTKPSEPGFDGFDGAPLVESRKIEGPPKEPQEPCPPAPRSPSSINSAVDCSTVTERVMSWAEWKAAALNKLFLELGTAGQQGRITDDTIRHGERAWMTNRKHRDAESQKQLRPE